MFLFMLISLEIQTKHMILYVFRCPLLGFIFILIFNYPIRRQKQQDVI